MSNPTLPVQRFAWLSTDRLFAAALLASIASFLLKVYGAMNPGLPQSTVIATQHIPFFEHMIACGYVFFAVLIGGKFLEPLPARFPRLCIAIIVFTTIGAGLTQWFFPNY